MKKTIQKVEFRVKILFYMMQLLMKRIKLKRIFLLFTSFITVYLFYALYSIYTSIIDKEAKLHELKFDYLKPEKFFVNASFEGSMLSHSMSVNKLSVKVDIFKERLFTVKCEKMEFYKDREISCRNTLNLHYNKKYKFEKLQGIKSINEIKFRIFFFLGINVFTIPIKIPVWKSYVMKLGNGGEVLNVISHKIHDRNNEGGYSKGEGNDSRDISKYTASGDYRTESRRYYIDTRFKLAHNFLNIKMPKFSFTIRINDKEFASVSFLEYNFDRVYFFRTEIINLESFSHSMPKLLDDNLFSMQFSDFNFKNTRKSEEFRNSETAENELENEREDKNTLHIIKNCIINCVKSCEIGIKKKYNKAIEFTKEVPGIDLIFESVKNNNNFTGNFSIHKTIIDNFVPSFLFLNKVEIKPVKIGAVLFENGNESQIGTVEICICNKNSNDVHRRNINLTGPHALDYLSFSFSLIVDDLSGLANNFIQPEKYLKLQILGESFVERLFKEFYLLWDFRSNFKFTKLSKISTTKNSIDFKSSRINNYDLNLQVKEENDKFFIESLIKLPKIIKEEHFKMSWNNFNFVFENSTFEMKLKLFKGSIFGLKNFNHISEVFKGTSIKSILEIKNVSKSIDSFFSVNELIQTVVCSTKIRIQNEVQKNALENEGQNDTLPFNLTYNYKMNEKPTLQRILSRFNVKIGNIESINKFQLILDSHAIKTENEYFSLNCSIKTVETEFCLKGIQKEDFQYFTKIKIPALNLNFTLSKDTLHGITIKNEHVSESEYKETTHDRKNLNDNALNLEKSLSSATKTISGLSTVILNFEMFYEYLEFYEQLSFVPLKSMNYFSYCINSFLNLFIFRIPSTKSINLKNRNLENITKFTNENLILDFNSFMIRNALKGYFKIKFPISSINKSPICNSNFNWECIEILVTGIKENVKKKLKIRIKQGSLGLRIEESISSSNNNEILNISNSTKQCSYYQKDDTIGLTFCMDLAFFSCDAFEFSIYQPENVELSFCESNFYEDFSYFFETRKDLNKIVKARNEILEIFRNDKNNGFYLFEEFFDVKQNKIDLILGLNFNGEFYKNLSIKIGNILKRIQLVSYPLNLQAKAKLKVDRKNKVFRKLNAEMSFDETIKITYNTDNEYNANDESGYNANDGGNINANVLERVPLINLSSEFSLRYLIGLEESFLAKYEGLKKKSANLLFNTMKWFFNFCLNWKVFDFKSQECKNELVEGRQIMRFYKKLDSVMKFKFDYLIEFYDHKNKSLAFFNAENDGNGVVFGLSIFTDLSNSGKNEKVKIVISKSKKSDDFGSANNVASVEDNVLGVYYIEIDRNTMSFLFYCITGSGFREAWRKIDIGSCIEYFFNTGKNTFLKVFNFWKK